MGKKKGHKDGKSKVPKTIAGVKVPKELRKGGQFAKLMHDPMVREIALAALAAGLAARKDARQAAKRAARDAGQAADDVAVSAGQGAGWVKAALGAAAVEAGRMVIDAIEDAGARTKPGDPRNGGSGSEAGAAGAETGGVRH
jgi:hypothetical protein